MSSIIVAAPPFTGELQPLLDIASVFVHRGHTVSVVTGSRFAARVRAVGACFVGLTGAADFDDRRLLETFPAAADVAPGPEQLNFLFGLAADAIAEEHRLLQLLLADAPEAVLITNSVSLGAWPVGLGAPGRRPRRWLAVGCNPLALPSADTTPFGPMPTESGADGRSTNRAVNAQLQIATEPARQRIEVAVRSLGAVDPVPSIFEGIVTVPDVFASLTIPGLEFKRSDAPENLHFVGVLPAPLPPDWVPPLWWPDLHSGLPVIVVTQGTFANRDLTELIRPVLDAFADEAVLVVAALGKAVEALSGPVPSNARVEAFLPFGALLPHADLFITNGGFGATQQALAAGVPVILAGVSEDKPLVAARIASGGFGRDLQTARPAPMQLRQAGFEVLTDLVMKSNVKRLAAEYSRYDAVEIIEHLIFDDLG